MDGDLVGAYVQPSPGFLTHHDPMPISVKAFFSSTIAVATVCNDPGERLRRSTMPISSSVISRSGRSLTYANTAAPLAETALRIDPLKTRMLPSTITLAIFTTFRCYGPMHRA